MSQLRLSVVIPAHNEEENLPDTISALERALRAASIPHEILIVDDHSTDRTAEVLEELQRRNPDIRIVRNERSPGFGHAVHTGIEAFEGDAFCLVMADASDDPGDVVEYYRKLSEGYECVFGSRFTRQSRVVNYPLHKLVLNRLANLFIRLLFALKYNDVTNAFKCYRRTVLDGIQPILSHHFNLLVELPLKAIVRGYSYTVVPTHWYGRQRGISKLRIREMGSRYLFIVLYVFLERLLSRGDYRRVGISSPVQASPDRVPKLLQPGWAWLAFGAVAVVHALFVYTYPLNNLGGDTVGYYHVLINRTSNLLFAPGYPVLAGLPLRLDPIYDAVQRHPAAFRKALLIGQHAVELLCLAALLIAATRVYNRLTAALAVALAGASPRAMGVTSSVYPEWLQADLLMLALALCAFAWTAESRRRKLIWYSAAGATFTWCVLVKFNAIVFAPALLAFLIFEKAPWRRRVAMLLVTTAVAAGNVLFFELAIHQPATGSFALTRDRSWVLMTKLDTVYHGRLPNPNGPATKRWLALSAVLPPTYSVASVGPFMHVDAVPAAVRDPARRDAAFLLTADEEVVDRVLRLYSLPAQFALGVSSIPISYYIGLAESDNLGVQVFYESVRHAPGPYVRSVLRNSIAAVWYATTEPTYPTIENVSNVTERVVPAGGTWLRLERRSDSRLPYDSSEPILWGPGYRLFSRATAIPITRSHTVALMTLGVLIALWHGLRYGWRLRSAVPVLLAVLLCVFVMLSYALIGFRWKEWRCALPVVAILVATTLGWWLPQVVRVINRMKVR